MKCPYISPEKVREAMRKAEDDGARVGVELAKELFCKTSKKVCQGTYLVAIIRSLR